MFKLLYDLLIYVTENYSSMPDGFKKRFSEAFLIRARLQVGTINNYNEDWNDYD